MEEGKEMAAHCSSHVVEEKLSICMSNGRWRTCWDILYLVYALFKVKTVQISRTPVSVLYLVLCTHLLGWAAVASLRLITLLKRLWSTGARACVVVT